MAKISTAQQKIVAQVKAGHRLLLDEKTGRYVMYKDERQQFIDCRTVEALLRDGVLFKGIGAQCMLSEEHL